MVGKNQRTGSAWVLTRLVACLVVILCVLVSGMKVRQNEIRRLRFHERDIRTDAAVELGKEVERRIGFAITTGMSKANFQKHFGELNLTDGKDLSAPERERYTYTSPSSQRVFYLTFENDVLKGCHSSHSSGDVKVPIKIESESYLVGESIRRIVLSLGIIVWVAVLIVAILTKQPRWALSNALIVLSMVCILAWLLAPNYTLAIISNDKLVLGFAMLVLSLIVGAFSPVKDI